MNQGYVRSGNLSLRVLFSVAVMLGLVLASLPASPARPRSTSAQDSPDLVLPEGDWYTYANSDDVLVLEVEGSTLWAGTRAGGVARWDTTAGTFVQFLKPQDGLAGNTVRDIYIDSGGHKWFATDHGLSVLDDKDTADKADDEWHTYTRETTGNNLPSNRVNAVAFDEAGYLWIGMSQYWDNEVQGYAGGGIAKVDTKGNLDPSDDAWLNHFTVANTLTRTRTEVTLGLASDNITAILPVPGNRIWVATDRHWDFRQFDQDTVGQWSQVYGGLSRLDHQGTPETDDDDWQTWNCEENSGFACLVHGLELDAKDYVWATTRGRGVMAFRYDEDRFLDYVQFRRSDGLPSDDVYAVAFGPPDDPQWQNTVWIGAYDSTGAVGGVTVLDHKGTILDKSDDEWNVRNPRAGQPITAEDGLPDDQVQALTAGDGVVWMGTGGLWGMAHGIAGFDLGQRTFTQHLATASSTLPFNYVVDLAVGEAGTAWENKVAVATGNERERRYEYGLLEWDTNGTADPMDDAWTRHTKENTDDNGQEPWTGLASNSITGVAADGDNVWISTQPVTWNDRWQQWTDGGISTFDGSRWTLRTDQNTGGDWAGLRHDALVDIAVGCGGEIWASLGNLRDNSGFGLNALEPGDPHSLSDDQWWEPIRFTTIPSDLVTGIAPACESDQLWISTAPSFRCTTSGYCSMTGGGAARYDYDTGTWTKWTTDNGIESYRDSNVKGELMSVAVGPDGTAWVGAWGTRGMTRQQLIDDWPYVPAAISWFRNGAWSSHSFGNDGWVSSIAVDHEGRVWAATSRGGVDINPPDGKEDDSLPIRAAGGIKLTIDGSEWKTFTPDNSPLVTNDIEAVTVDADGGVWIGTNGWGIMHLQPPKPTPTVTITPTKTPTPTITPTPFSTPLGASPTPTRTTHRIYMPLTANNWFGQSISVPTAVPYTATPTRTPTQPATSTPTPSKTPTQAQPSATPQPTNTPPPTSTPTITPTPGTAPSGVWCERGSTNPACSDANAPLFPQDNLHDIAFADELHGLIVGENGFVARTSDGGDTWTWSEWSSATFRDVFVVDAQVAFIAGDDKNIWRTTDGGEYFWRMEMPSVMLEDEEDFYAVHAFSQNDAWALGHQRGTILHWNGQQWDFLRWTGYPYTGMAMPAPDQGWAIAENSNIYEFNGQWSEMIAKRASAPLRAVDMYSSTEGWAAGDDGVTVRYANGQWTEYHINGLADGGFTGLDVRRPNDVWATAGIGSGDQATGAIYRYNGTRWERVDSTSTGPLNAIWMNDALTAGWAVGRDGLARRYVVP